MTPPQGQTASRPSAPAPVEVRGADRYPEVIRAFDEVAELIGEGAELDALLHVVATKICALLGICRCSVYLRDPCTGLYRGQIAEVGRDVDAAIKRLTAGIEADGFTQEILRTKQPVLIGNVQHDPRPVRSTMLDWNVRAMLGVPMVLEGEVIGLLFLDNEAGPHDYTPEEQSLAATFAHLAAIAIAQAQTTAELRASLDTVARQNTALRRAAAIDERLTRLVLEGANLRQIADAIAELTCKPCAIHDATFRRLASGHPPGEQTPRPRLLDARYRSDPAVAQALAGLDPGRPGMVGPVPSAGLHHRFLLAPITVRGAGWGHLVLMEYGSRLGARDMIVARQSATVIALELSAERRAAEAESRASEALARDLIYGSADDDTLERRADFHGLALHEAHVVCLIIRPGQSAGSEPSAERVADALLAAAPERRALVTAIEDGVAMILELHTADGEPEALGAARDLAARVMAEIAPDGTAVAGISSICREPRAFPAAYHEARQVTRCALTYATPGARRVLCADELGPGRVFLAGTDRREADRFAQEALGPLLDPALPGGGDLLATLETFFRRSRSVRRSAAALGVHENTIRYRLARIDELTGMDVVNDGEHQLTIQLALLVLRLEDRLPASRRTSDAAAALEGATPVAFDQAL